MVVILSIRRLYLIFSNLKNEVREFFDIKVFLRHNKIINKNNCEISSSGLVLFEEFLEFPRIIAFSYFANYWGQSGYKLFSYNVSPTRSSWGRIKVKLSQILLPFHHNYKINCLFSSMGIKKRISPRILKLSELEKELVHSLKGCTKENVLDLEFLEIPIGDCFYDWYLRSNNLGTINTKDEYFFEQLEDFLGLVKWWDNFYKKYPVIAVNTTHSVYLQGMVGRVAVYNNIPTYVISYDKNYKLSRNNWHAEGEFHFYDPKQPNFYSFSFEKETAKELLSQLKTNSSFITKEHSVVSGFRNRNDNFTISPSDTINALIAPHCFTESVHQQGKMLFADYQTWFQYLLDLSSRTPYNWYVKPHPYFNLQEKNIFKNLVSNHRHLKFVPAESNLTNLFKQGIDVVFTAYGTIGFDASSENIPVVTASQNCSYKNYNFCLKPKNIAELDSIIYNLKSAIKNYKIEEDEILHFFSVHYLRSTKSWLLGAQLGNLIDHVGGYENIFKNSSTLSFWVNNLWANEIHTNLNILTSSFIESNLYMMDGYFNPKIADDKQFKINLPEYEN